MITKEHGKPTLTKQALTSEQWEQHSTVLMMSKYEKTGLAQNCCISHQV